MMAMGRRYRTVDVFSSTPLLGNPVAVVLDAEGLCTGRMQAIARWTNLSETTFVLPPDHPGADYRLRIFTPLGELPFAGHPTLGSAHAALESGVCHARDGRLIQQCGTGLVEVTLEDPNGAPTFSLRMPPAEHRPLTADEIGELSAILGSRVCGDPPPECVNVGAVWVVAELEDVETLLALQPDLARSAAFERKIGATGISVFATRAMGVETRSFAPSCGVNEDPVCGSGNGSIASFRLRAGQIAPGESYIASQGRITGREGSVAIRVSKDGSLSVGGSCVTTAEGMLHV